MANNEQFQASVVAGIETPGSAEAAKTFAQLLKLTESLEGAAKLAGQRLVEAFTAGKKPEELSSQIRVLQRELKFLGTVNNGAELFKSNDVTRINDINRAIGAAARAYDSMRQSQALSRYELGLESKTTSEATKNLAILEKNLKAVDLALQNSAGNTELQKKKQLLTDNHALLQIVISDLKQQAEQEKQNAAARANQAKGNTLNQEGAQSVSYTRRETERARQVQSFNAAGNLNLTNLLGERQAQLKAIQDSARLAVLNAEGERQMQLKGIKAQDLGTKLNEEGQRQLDLSRRITEIKRREAEGSASSQTRVSNTQLDYSQRGRDYADQQFTLKNARIDSSLMPGKQDIALNRLMAQSTSTYLGQVYKDAGLVQSSLAATLRDGPKVRQLIGEIRDIEAKLVAERSKGNINLQEEARLLDQIRTKMLAASNARRDQTVNDPEQRQANLDRQSRNMLNRAGGEGGAALLAVQASLMANYSILNSTVGAFKSAITTSVELEAAFRNVQAVTATTKTEMSGLEDKIKGVAASSKFTSLEVANAALILGQAGLSARQVGEALQPVVMLASAAGTSISQAVDLVTSIIGVFDKKTSDIADIANKVTQAANSSKISVEKLALGFQYVGNAASQVGITFEETTAALAAMSNAGIKNGSTMGTGLRQFLTETEKPSKEFLQTLQRLGLSLSDIDFKSNGLIGVTKKLREAGFVASDAIKSFDVRGAAAFNALIADPAGLERQYRLLQDSQAGLAANEVQMDSLKSQSARLTTSLGNLASAGFAPLSNTLAHVAGGFASVIQFASEHNVVMGVAGTAIAALLASGAVSYLANMAAGALRLAAGAGTASVAVTALQTASKAGSLGVLLSSISSSIGAMGSLTAAAVPATAATWSLTGAVTALRTAVASLSIVTGIGIVLAVATAAFYAFEYATGRASAEIDKLKAATNSSKGVFEEKDAAVKSLTKKIEDLTYRESSLRENSENLKTESLALNSQFGAMGLTIDANNTSFDTMIGKLRALKKEMQDIRKQSLETALADNKALLQKQTEKAQADQKDAAGGGGWTKNFSKQLAQVAVDQDRNLSSSERLKMVSASNQLAGGNLNNMTDVSGATLLVQKLASELRSKPGGGDAKELASLDRLAASLLAVGKNLSEINLTRSEIARQEGALRKDEGYQKFNESGKFGTQSGRARTFEESLPKGGNLELLALEAAGMKGEKDPITIFEAVKAEQEKRAEIYKNRLKQITEMQLSKDISSETADTAKQMINARKEKEKNEYLAIADATVDEATLTYGRQKRLLMSQQKNAKIKDDRVKQAEIEDQLGEIEIAFKNRAQTSPSKALDTAEELRAIREQNKQNIFDRRQRGSGKNINDSLSERSLRVQADAADSEANASKAAIKTAQSMEEVGTLMDEAIEAKFDAKKKRLEALTLKQKAESKAPGYDAKIGDIAHKLEMEALNESENSKISTFADSFISLIEAAMGRLDTVTKRINETKRRISEDKMDSEDKVFAAQQELREVELAILTGKKVKSDSKSATTYGSAAEGRVTRFGPNGVLVDNRGTGSAKTLTNLGPDDMTPTGVSGAIRESLNQRRNRLIVESTKLELEENEKQLKEYGDNTTGLIGDLGEQYRLAKETSKSLRDKLKTETDEKVSAALQAQLNVSSDTEAKSFQNLRGARGDKQKLQVENFNIRKRASENTEILPQELSMDNLMKKLDEVWDKYQATVGKMDVVKTVSEGLSSMLGSVTGSLGNAFAAIVTGTKSVKNAFKDMSAGIIKSMIDILAQALAMQAAKAIFQMLGMGVGLMAGGASAAGADVGSTSAMTMDFSTMAASGGLIIPGGIQRVKGMAGGGPVTGGVTDRDSVHTMLMPGEFVVKKSAVEAVGTDYLHSLNSAANSVVSSSSPKVPAPGKTGEPSVTNVWIVSPDQKPTSMGPRDVVVAVSDDISRGGSIKKLIKQVIMNG